MRRLAAILTVATLLFSLTITAATAPSDQLQGVNKLRANQSISVLRLDDKNIPNYIEGTLSKGNRPGDETAATFQFLEDHRAAYRMESPSEELTLRRTDIDRQGIRHTRFQQVYQHLPVIGGELIAHFSTDGTLRTLNGTYHPQIKLDIIPLITATDASGIAITDLLSFFGPANPTEPELVVFPWQGKHFLSWRLFLISDSPMGRWEYLVDAGNSEVIFKANRIMDADVWGSGIGVMGDSRDWLDIYQNGSTYYMIDYTRQAGNDVHGHAGQMPNGNYIQTNIAGGSFSLSVHGYGNVNSEETNTMLLFSLNFGRLR